MTETEELEYLTLKKKKAMAGASSATPQPQGGIPVPPAVSSAARAITMPGRGFRGMGVGLEQLMLHPSRPGAALSQAADAVQPGFEAGPGQKLGAFAGGFGDPVNLAANEVLPGGSFLKSLAGGAMMGSGSSLLDQLSQGKINRGQTGLSGAAGGLIGGLTHGMAKLLSGFLRNAAPIFEGTTGTPPRATEIFKANPGIEKAYTGTEEEVASKASSVMDALTNQYDAAKAFYKKAAGDVGANLNSREKALAKPIAPMRIPDSIESLKPAVNASRANPTNKDLTSAVFKSLLHIRQSIDHHVDYANKSGVPEISSVQAGGLKELRNKVNQLIEDMPGGEILRDADKIMAAASEIYGKLQPMMKRTGDAVEFLKKTFEGKSANANEDMINLLALEKATGQPVVNDLFKAMTMSHFSQNLAGNKISRSVAGVSPFLMSAMLRVVGLPFQASLPLSAVGVSLARSPKVQGMAVRGAQKFGPGIEKAAKPTATALLNLIRQRYKSEDSGSQQ